MAMVVNMEVAYLKTPSRLDSLKIIVVVSILSVFVTLNTSQSCGVVFIYH